ncbi:MAG TPA: hypothetical protein VKA86_10630 [Candidatus Krumholzibacteria bacterium]|nr:hypothetical protein [Candidatus Krumholzibacteria bacterium]
MSDLLVAAFAGAVAVVALAFSFVSMRNSRDAVQRIDKLAEAPRVDDVHLPTRNGHDLTLDDFRGHLTLLVTLPVRGVDQRELAELAQLRHRHGPEKLEVVAIPIGTETELDMTPAREAGEIPVLATAAHHPLADEVEQTFGRVDAAYTKLLIDERGRVVACFAPETDPRSAELSRAIREALAPA